MKKTILAVTVTAFIFCTGFTSFAQHPTQTNSEKKDAEKDQQRMRDSLSDYREFKLDAEKKISANQKKITELKEKKSKASKDVRDKYDKKVVAFERKNNDLKRKLTDYNSTNNDKWESFKREFSHDMDELGNALKDITVDNAR
jgi:chromosome segregation ATPase